MNCKAHILSTKLSKVLGVFAAIHTFNDQSEEALAAANLPFNAELTVSISEFDTFIFAGDDLLANLKFAQTSEVIIA